ncbi:MAG TPA: hypothetical protein VMY05_08155 [Acidobacteriota bacterium]|nr:hypothetical protein [Acidobacteriota bacterium]
MKGRALTIVVMLLVLAVACFISGPAVSGEHPWDADEEDKQPLNPGSDEDTLIAPESYPEMSDSPDWYWYLYVLYNATQV